tara:strand:- start:1870 stop:2481 length:612 start_codon:yes stop_codon:yes gene_type:complete
MNDTLLLFSTGEGHDSGWLSTHSRAYPVSMLKSIKPYGKNTLNLFFAKGDFEDIVSLSIENGKHVEVSRSIYQATNDASISAIVVADVANQDFISSHIYGVSLQSDPVLYYNKIANATQVNVIPISTKTKQLNSMTLCNIHSAAATVQVFLSNSTDNWYIIKDVVIPVGSTLKLDSDELDYDGDIFNLYVKLGGTTPVDVVVR